MSQTPKWRITLCDVLLCVYVSWDVRWLIWSTTLMLKTVLLAFCVQIFTYDFVLNWHVHWYICTAVWFICPRQLYHCKLILICHYFTKLACGEAPKYHFLCHSLWSFPLHNNVCVCLWCGLLLLNTLISLHERCSNPVSKTHAPDPFCPPQQMTCYRSVFTHVWGHLCRLCPQSASSFLFFYI